MKTSFWKGVFTDKDGTPSSKRVILFMLLLTFLTVVGVNLFIGRQLTQILSEQLFYLIIYALASVFGENITGIFNKGAKAKPETDEPETK